MIAVVETRSISIMSEILDYLLQPFNYAFMLRGLWASLIVGVVCPILGTYVVLRGMAFMGDALAHIILPGVVIAFLLEWPLAVGALIVGILAALAINAISKRTEIKEDAAIGVVFAGAFALGVALISVQRTYAVDLAHILFGDLLSVSTADLWLMAGLGGLVLLAVFAFYKEFLVLSFDPVLATSLRLPVSFLQSMLIVLLVVVIVISIQAVGVALVLAMLVTPASGAYLLTRRLPSMMLIAAGIGSFSAVLGLYLSYYVNITSGPAIVLVQTVVFLLVFMVAPQRGVLWKWVRSRQGSNI
jgi:ABC-type Mn2+/Zn2+ transport system permease subunit